MRGGAGTAGTDAGRGRPTPVRGGAGRGGDGRRRCGAGRGRPAPVRARAGAAPVQKGAAAAKITAAAGVDREGGGASGRATGVDREGG